MNQLLFKQCLALELMITREPELAGRHSSTSWPTARVKYGRCGGTRVDVRPNCKEPPVMPTKLRYDCVGACIGCPRLLVTCDSSEIHFLIRRKAASAQVLFI